MVQITFGTYPLRHKILQLIEELSCKQNSNSYPRSTNILFMLPLFNTPLHKENIPVGPLPVRPRPYNKGVTKVTV